MQAAELQRKNEGSRTLSAFQCRQPIENQRPRRELVLCNVESHWLQARSPRIRVPNWWGKLRYPISVYSSDGCEDEKSTHHMSWSQ